MKKLIQVTQDVSEGPCVPGKSTNARAQAVPNQIRLPRPAKKDLLPSKHGDRISQIPHPVVSYSIESFEGESSICKPFYGKRTNTIPTDISDWTPCFCKWVFHVFASETCISWETLLNQIICITWNESSFCHGYKKANAKRVSTQCKQLEFLDDNWIAYASLVYGLVQISKLFGREPHCQQLVSSSTTWSWCFDKITDVSDSMVVVEARNHSCTICQSKLNRSWRWWLIDH